MKRTSNIKSRELTSQRIPFIANNLFAESHGENYYVFSYGHHWILYAYVDGIWYENIDKYSTTTSKHKSQSRPNAETVELTKSEIHKLY